MAANVGELGNARSTEWVLNVGVGGAGGAVAWSAYSNVVGEGNFKGNVSLGIHDVCISGGFSSTKSNFRGNGEAGKIVTEGGRTVDDGGAGNESERDERKVSVVVGVSGCAGSPSPGGGVVLDEVAYEKMSSSNLVGLSSALRHANPGITTGVPMTSPFAPGRRLRRLLGEVVGGESGMAVTVLDRGAGSEPLSGVKYVWKSRRGTGTAPSLPSSVRAGSGGAGLSSCGGDGEVDDVGLSGDALLGDPLGVWSRAGSRGSRTSQSWTSAERGRAGAGCLPSGPTRCSRSPEAVTWPGLGWVQVCCRPSAERPVAFEARTRCRTAAA